MTGSVCTEELTANAGRSVTGADAVGRALLKAGLDGVVSGAVPPTSVALSFAAGRDILVSPTEKVMLEPGRNIDCS